MKEVRKKCTHFDKRICTNIRMMNEKYSIEKIYFHFYKCEICEMKYYEKTDMFGNSVNKKQYYTGRDYYDS